VENINFYVKNVLTIGAKIRFFRKEKTYNKIKGQGEVRKKAGRFNLGKESFPKEKTLSN